MLRILTVCSIGALCIGIRAQIRPSWVVPSAFSNKNATSTSSFPFTYTNYVRYMQAIDKTVMGSPRVIEGFAVRPRAWGTGQLKAFTVKLEVRVSLSANAVNALDGTYAKNVKGKQSVVYKGPVHFPVPTGNSPAEFSATIWFTKPFVYLGTDPLLIDIIPLDPCAGGGDSRGSDFDPTSTGMGSLLGKNKNGCGIPTSGGSAGRGGFVLKFFGSSLMPYGLACKGSNGFPVIFHSGGGPKRGNSTFKLELANARASSAAILFVGLSRDTFGRTPLPLDLSPAGMPTCFLWTDIFVVGSAPTDGTGRATIPFPIPNLTSLADVPLFGQWLVIDQGANPANLTSSSGGIVVIR